MNSALVAKHLMSSRRYELQLNNILKPLFEQSEVRYFSYNRFYRNQSWIGLYSDARPVEIGLSAGRGPLFVDAQGISIASGSYLHKDLHDLFKINVDSKQVENFFAQENNPIGQKVVQNGLLLVRKGIHYDESFYFSLLDTTIPDRLYYYCIINDLKRFSLYFLEKAKKLIVHTEKMPIKFEIPLDNGDAFASSFVKHDDGELKFPVNKFCFGTEYGDTFLSRQEFNCLRQIALGRSQKHIGEELGLSPRTVESYVINIKNKLNAETKEELVGYYKAFADLDSIDNTK
jgi:DNA-binding CsgD family transcriptional regulator